jgi:hypothetical protein
MRRIVVNVVKIVARADALYVNRFTHDPGIMHWVIEACSRYVLDQPIPVHE